MENIRSILRRTWAEINIDNIKHNYNVVQNAIGDKTKLCCVIKANAYGHGAVELAKLYQAWGADYLSVSNIEEAIQLRNANISIPILVMGYTPPECAKDLSNFNISQCVYSLEYAEALNYWAIKSNVSVTVHIKIDTGMGRIGLVCRSKNCSEIKSAIEICLMSNLITEGIFTHFSVADEEDISVPGNYTMLQYESFVYAIDYLKKSGFDFKIKHCANSAAIFVDSKFHLDMVRAGIVLYGLAPSQKRNIVGLKPAMSLKTTIAQIKNISIGESIGYGRMFVADRAMKVATLTIGYADGLSRASSGYNVLVGNFIAPIVGRICMDQLMVDVTNIECKLGDIVTVFSDFDLVSADTLAKHIGTINYEVISNVGERVPRIYLQNNKIVGIRDLICNI